MTRRPAIARTRLPRARAAAEIAATDDAYAHMMFAPETSIRRPTVRTTLVARTCGECGRVALDVRAPWGDEGALCASGVGCQGRADRAARIVREGL